ncbi:unnamed protein product, partial [Meganyctiphanes norvegica]
MSECLKKDLIMSSLIAGCARTDSTALGMPKWAFSGEWSRKEEYFSSMTTRHGFPIKVFQDCHTKLHMEIGWSIHIGECIFLFHENLLLDYKYRVWSVDNRYISPRDGNDSTAPRLAKYDGHSNIREVVSTNNSLYIFFHSDSSTFTDTGFKLNWITELAYDYDYYSCDNNPESGDRFDPTCGRDEYHGKFLTKGSYSAYINVHYDGSHHVERGITKAVEEEGACYDSGYSLVCFCNHDLCNNHLCQHCTTTTTYPSTATHWYVTTTPWLDTTTQPPSTPWWGTTSQPPITTESPTSIQSPTPAGKLECFSCIGCSDVNEDTGVESSEEFLTCFTAIELGTGHLVIRGGSPDFYEDGACRNMDGMLFCFCDRNRCNNEAAAEVLFS